MCSEAHRLVLDLSVEKAKVQSRLDELPPRRSDDNEAILLGRCGVVRTIGVQMVRKRQVAFCKPLIIIGRFWSPR